MDDRQTDNARRHVSGRAGEELLFNRTLGENLRDRRQEAEITQEQLAGQAGMSRGSIANIERGEQAPSLYRLLLMCAALRCELTEILPPNVFSAESVAGTIGHEYSTAVSELRRQAERKRHVVRTRG